MSENPATTPDASATALATDSVPASAAAPAQGIDLSTIPDDVLLKDRRVNHLIGNAAQKQAARERERLQAEAYEQARREREEQLMKEAEENPYAFSQKWLSTKAQERATEELNGLRARTQTEYATAIGRSLAELPEWGQMTPEEMQTLIDRASNLADEDVLPTFNRAAIDLVADKRAQARLEAEMSKRIAAERKAWETDQEARRLKGEDSPDLRAGQPTAAPNIHAMSDAEFNRFYEANIRR